MERALRCCLIATSVFGLLLAGGARADDRYDVARVSDQRGSLAVRGVEEDDYSYLERNSVLREGDVLWTDESGRAELELERGSWLRLAEDTKVEFRRLGKSPELRLWSGSLYADLSDRVDGVLRVKTPVGDIDIRKDSLIRVDLSGEQSARVSVHNGSAEIFADKGEAVRLGPGERLYIEADKAPGEIKRFDRSDLDGFDRYHRERVDYWLERPAPREIGDDVVGARELRDYGSWVSVDNSTYWRPTVVSGWRPYSTGYWSHMSGMGPTWIDYQPWGYTTSHYGRWMYRPVFGWLWAPGLLWGPAFVSWSTYGDYCGWAPLDPWGRPAYYGPGAFNSVNFVFDNRSWSFCRRDNFFYSRHHRNYGGGAFGNGGRYFHRAEDLVIDKSRFGLVRDVNREIGAPKDRIRGPLIGKDGVTARDRVASNEQKIPGKRLDLIQKRFGDNPRRDLDKTRVSTGIERLQRSPALALGKENVIKGDDAIRRTFPKGRSADNTPLGGIGKPDTTRDRADNGGPVNRTGVRGPNPDRDSPFRRGDSGPKALGPGQGGDSPFRKPDGNREGNRDPQANRNPVDNTRKDGKEQEDRQRADKDRADRERQQKYQADRERQQKDQKDQQERQRQDNERRQREQQDRERQQREQSERDRQQREQQDRQRQDQERQRQERDRQERDRQDRGKKVEGNSPFDDSRYRRDGGGNPVPNGGSLRGDASRGDNRSPFAGNGGPTTPSRVDNSRGDTRSPFVDYGRRTDTPSAPNGLAPSRGSDSPFVRRDSTPQTYRDFPNRGGDSGGRTYSPPPVVDRSGGSSPFSGNRSGYSGGNPAGNSGGNSRGSGGYSGGNSGGYSRGSTGGYSGSSNRSGGGSGGGNGGGGSSGGSRSGGSGGGGRLPGK